MKAAMGFRIQGQGPSDFDGQSSTSLSPVKGVHLTTLLRERAASTRNIPKRVRTRRILLAAVARVMEKGGYEGLTVDAIVAEAGLARGTFYLYFSDRADAAYAVVRVFAATLRICRPRSNRQLSAMEAIFRTNLYYALSYAANRSLLAGRESLMRDRPELAKWRDAVNRRWAEVVLGDFDRRMRTKRGVTVDRQTRLVIRAAIAMADEFLREIYVYKSPSLARLAESPEDVAYALSVAWHRVVFGCDPTPSCRQ